MDKDILKTLVPINSLTLENFREVAAGKLVLEKSYSSFIPEPSSVLPAMP